MSLQEDLDRLQYNIGVLADVDPNPAYVAKRAVALKSCEHVLVTHHYEWRGHKNAMLALQQLALLGLALGAMDPVEPNGLTLSAAVASLECLKLLK